MEDTSQFRVGIIGCGYQGNVLARAIAQVDSLKVTACADIVPERAVALAGSVCQASAHTCAEDLLAHSDVDIVMVATPHHVLAPISQLAIQAGKHVLGEKPCGMNAKELAEIEISAAKAGVCYLAGYSFRYAPAWYKVYELLQARVIGEIQTILGFIATSSMDEGWKSAPETGGGPLLYVGSHLVDQVIWYLQDEPVEVSARTWFRNDTHADQTSSFQVKFARGATAQLVSTQNAGKTYSSLEIIGQTGIIRMRPCGFLDYEIDVFSRSTDEYQKTATIHEPLTGDVRTIKHCRQLNEFVAAIRANDSPFVTAASARQVMEVIDAVFDSSKTHQTIQLASKITA